MRFFGVILCFRGLWQINIAVNSLERIESLLICGLALMIECTCNIIDSIEKEREK